MLSVDVFKLAGLIGKIPATIIEKFAAEDSAKLAYRYYEKDAIDLDLVLVDKAIEKNKTDFSTCSWLHILKGDLLTEKGMRLYQKKVSCQIPFKKSIYEFNKCIKIDAFNSVAWLGKSFNHLMIGLICVNDIKDETNGCYHFYQALFSADAGLNALEEEGQNEGCENDLYAMKGGAYYLIGDDEEGDKCYEKAKIGTLPIKEY